MNEAQAAELQEFLAWQRSQRESGVTLEVLHKAMRDLVDAHAAHEKKCDLRWDQHAEEHRSFRMRLEANESRVARVEGAKEITGRHNIEALQAAARAEAKAEAAARRDSLPPISRWLAKAVTHVAEAKATHAAVFVIGTGLAWLLHHLRVLP